MTLSAVASERWTGLYEAAAPSSRLVFLADVETTTEAAARAPNLFGQDDVAELLRSIVHESIDSRRSSRRSRCGPAIALYGRYGQGKSSVLNIVLSSFQNRRIRGRPVVCRALDVSHLKPDDVQYAFDLVVAPWFFRRRLLSLLVLVPLGAAAVWAATRMMQVAGFETLVSLVLGTTAISVGIALSWFLRRLSANAGPVLGIGYSALKLREAWMLNDRERVRDLVAQFTEGAPDLVLIDNLDRATVEQQKALLRSIYRHRQVLTATLVVAFDEGPLIGSDPTPESPQELLQKTFDVALQLSPMTPQDATEMALHLCAALAGSNKDAISRARTQLFGVASVVADLARILLFHRRHSVRFGKQFVNGVFAAAELLGIDNPPDLSSLMRLHGLFVFLPWIRHDPSALADFMRRDDADGLIGYAEADFGRSISVDLKAQVHRFVQGTRHMQPAFASWLDFTGRFGERLSQTARRTLEASVEEDYPTLREDGWLVWWIGWDLAIAGASADPKARLGLYRSCFARAGAPYTKDAGEIADWTQVPQGSAVSARELEVAWFTWQYLLARIWIADSEVLAIMPETARQRLLTLDLNPRYGCDGIRSDNSLIQAFVRLLPSAPPGSHSLAQAALFASSGRQIGRRPQGEAVREWLAHANRKSEEPLLTTSILGGIRLEPDEPAPVIGALPELNVSGVVTREDFEAAAEMITAIRLLRSYSCQIQPVNVSKFLAQLVEADDLSVGFGRDALSVLRAACPPFLVGGYGPWDRAFVEELRAGALQEAGEVYLTAERSWFERSVSHRPDDWTMLFLADVCGAADTVTGLVRCMRQPLSWDLGYLEALSAAADSTVFAEYFPDRAHVVKLFGSSAERMRESDDLIEAQIGERLLLRLAPSVEA